MIIPSMCGLRAHWLRLEPWIKLNLVTLLALGACSGAWVMWADWPDEDAAALPAKADAMVVLGGGGLERPREAWRLFQEGRAPKVIVTGDGGTIVSELKKQGLPAASLLHETEAKSTLQNARNVAPLLEGMQAKTVIVVTTWCHIRRAKLIFERTMPDLRFVFASEPRPKVLDEWQNHAQRHERASALYHFVVHGIWCF